MGLGFKSGIGQLEHIDNGDHIIRYIQSFI